MTEFIALLKFLLVRFERHTDKYKQNDMIQDATYVIETLILAITAMEALQLREYQESRKEKV